MRVKNNKLLILFCFFQSLVLMAEAQGIKELLQFARTIDLNAPFNKSSTHLQRDTEESIIEPDGYILPCSVKQLYGVPIQKTLLIAYEDTARAIVFFLPFDSSLHKQLDEVLGPSAGVWTIVEDEPEDTTGMIAKRRWILPEYIIVFECTRYNKLLRRTDDDDRIRILIGKRRF